MVLLLKFFHFQTCKNRRKKDIKKEHVQIHIKGKHMNKNYEDSNVEKSVDNYIFLLNLSLIHLKHFCEESRKKYLRLSFKKMADARVFLEKFFKIRNFIFSNHNCWNFQSTFYSTSNTKLSFAFISCMYSQKLCLTYFLLLVVFYTIFTKTMERKILHLSWFDLIPFQIVWFSLYSLLFYFRVDLHVGIFLLFRSMYPPEISI